MRRSYPRTKRFTAGGPVRDRGSEAYNGLYKVLFRVVIRHAYNNADHGRCTSFRTIPSPTSLEVMQGQGLVFQDDGVGFSVYIHENQVDGFISYLRRQGRETATGIQYWTWLSFVLVQNDPYFVGLTSLPIDTNPLNVNLYATDQNAHKVRDATLISRGAAMRASDLVAVTGAQFTVPVIGPLDQVVVRDISGQIVLVQPNDVDNMKTWLTINPPKPSKDKRDGSPNGPPQVHVQLDLDSPPQVYVQVDLSSLPLGLYEFSTRFNANGKTGPEPIGEITLGEKLYTAARPGPPLAFIDVLFSKPDASQDGIYPVPPLNENVVITPDMVGDVVYEMRFDTRQTWWQYYVVSQTPGSTLTDLEITGKQAAFTRAEKPVLLPNGETAILFQSDKTLAMREIPPERFALNGTRRDARGKLSRVRVDPLPTAAAAPVWPAPKDKSLYGQSDSNGTSEMYVYV